MPKYKLIFNGESATINSWRDIFPGVYVRDGENRNLEQNTISISRIPDLNDFLPYSLHREEIIEMLREIARTKKILVIKLVRKMTKWGLLDAKEFVDNNIC